MRGRGLLIAALACALLAAAAASLMSQTRTGIGPGLPPRAPAGAGGHSGPPAPYVPPAVAVACPCYTTEAIQAVLDTCGTILSTTCNAPAVTLGAFCSGPPVTNLGTWVQVAAANECSRTYQDLQTGEPVTETLAVTAAERDACTAILLPFCPS